jgi:hypothetical protein
MLASGVIRPGPPESSVISTDGDLARSRVEGDDRPWEIAMSDPHS